MLRRLVIINGWVAISDSVGLGLAVLAAAAVESVFAAWMIEVVKEMVKPRR
jgi:hypothetical protein